MRKLPAFAVAVTIAGSAVAAAPRTHTMDVSLPDGSVAHIEYVGDVAPQVTMARRPPAVSTDAWAMSLPSFAGFDRMMEQMRRRSEEMMRHAQQMPPQPNGAPYAASLGSVPAVGTSTTIVSVSNNGVTCTRTTQMVSQGQGKPPKVTSNLSGECGGAPAPANGPTHPA